MKKLFTFLAAALFSAGMMADVVYSFTLDATKHTAKGTYEVNGGSATFGADKFNERKGTWVYTLDGDAKEKNSKYILIEMDDALVEGAVISISGMAHSDPAKTDGQGFRLVDNHETAATEYAFLEITKKDLTTVEFTIPAGNALIGKKSFYILRSTGKSVSLAGVSIESTPSVEPVLSVNPEEVTLALTAAKPSDEATVTFSGKNLAAGEYSITVPNLAGFQVTPASVTVSADGKLSQQVDVIYTSDVDVDPANAEISLKIGELEAKVTINYSASFAKNYLSQSVNIEQWVLDNGKKTEDFKSVLEAANIEFENINELDSLNDEKDLRNEPYLGLKLKKQGARVACWVKAGDKIAVKFGALKDAVKIGVNGEYQDYPASDESSFIDKIADKDEYLEIITKSDKTIVIKQIMLNEDIADVVLPGGTAVDNTVVDVKATKRIINGQVIIEKNGKFYDLLGTEVR